MNLGEFTDFLFSQEESIYYFLISPCLLLFDAFVLGGKGVFHSHYSQGQMSLEAGFYCLLELNGFQRAE